MSQQRRPNRGNNREEAITKFVLGSKELEGKTAEFLYDKGWYSISDLVWEERTQVYRSRNASEAYTKWNVYIGRKKERPSRPRNDRKDDGENAAAEASAQTPSRPGRRDGDRRSEGRENEEERSGDRRPEERRNGDRRNGERRRNDRPSGDRGREEHQDGGQKNSDRRNQERRPRRNADRRRPPEGGGGAAVETKAVSGTEAAVNRNETPNPAGTEERKEG